MPPRKTVSKSRKGSETAKKNTKKSVATPVNSETKKAEKPKPVESEEESEAEEEPKEKSPRKRTKSPKTQAKESDDEEEEKPKTSAKGSKKPQAKQAKKKTETTRKRKQKEEEDQETDEESESEQKEQEEEESAEGEDSEKYEEVTVDKSKPEKVKMVDVEEKDENGKVVKLQPGEESKRKMPEPATEEEQEEKYDEMMDLLKFYHGNIPVVYIEKGKRVYHPMNAASIIDFPKKGYVDEIKFQFNGTATDKATDVIGYLKKLRGKKPRSRSGKTAKGPTKKPWSELYIPDKKGVYKMLGTAISIKYRPTSVPNPKRKKTKTTNSTSTVESSKKVVSKGNTTVSQKNKSKVALIESEEDALKYITEESKTIEDWGLWQAEMMEERLNKLKKSMWAQLKNMLDEDPTINDVYVTSVQV